MLAFFVAAIINKKGQLEAGQMRKEKLNP